MTDYQHFPRIIGRQCKRQRSAKAMAAITAIIILVTLLAISAIKGHEQSAVKKARAEERRYVMAHWDKVVNGEIRSRARKELAEGVR